MKKIILLFLVLVVFNLAYSQEYFSKFTPAEEHITNVFVFEFNNQLCLKATKRLWNDKLASTLAIVDDEGTVSKVLDLDDMYIGWENVLESNNDLIISGRIDSSYWIKKFDVNFNEIEALKLFEAASDSVFLLKKMIETSDHYIIVGDYNIFNGQESGKIIQINKLDFSLNKIVDIQTNQNDLELYEIEVVSPDSLIVLQTYQPGDQFSNVLRVNVFDADLNLLDFNDSSILSLTESSEFEILNNNQLVVTGYNHRRITCIDLNGNVLWIRELDEFFQDLEFFSGRINDIKIDQNGDLIAIGSLEFNGEFSEYAKGFVLKLSKDGDLIWHHTYQDGVNGVNLSTLFSSIYIQNNHYVFAGRSITYPAIESNYYWIVKTDLDGCIDPDDCGTDLILSTSVEEHEEKELFSIVQNPTMGSLQLKSNEKYKIEYYVYDFQGKVINHLKEVNKEYVTRIKIDHPGVYFVRAQTKNGNVQVKMFINH